MSSPENSTATVDRIGTLPDEILIHILSFVPTKQAFTTSILSKRWIHLWRYVPILDFTETNLEDRDSVIRFEEFIFSVIRSRHSVGNHSINTFILDIQRHSSRLHALVFGNSNTIAPEFPILILGSTTLVVLKLASFDMGADLFLNLITLPSLKTLHLKNINFDQDEHLILILQKCPILEYLQLSNIYGHSSYYWISDDNTLTKLKRADITICYCYFPMKALSNLEFLRIQLSEDYHPYDFPTFNNLTHLVVNYDWDIVVQVLQHCPKLQSLDLYQKLQGDYWKDDEDIADDDQENWAYPKSVPTCLSLNLTTCTMRDFAFAGLQRNHVMLARFILKNAKVLETTTIWCSRKRSKIEKLLSSCPRASAKCQLSIY